MSDLNLRTLATFATPEEAHALKGLLESQNIRVALEGAQIVGLMWYIGNAVGGVKLQVPAADWDRASSLLAEVRSGDSGSAWRCSACGVDVDGGFDVCWKCGAQRADHEASGRVSGPDGEKAILEPETDNADATDLAITSHEPDLRDDSDAEPTNPAEHTVERAWRASIFGILLPFGLLNVYSLWLLMEVVSEPLSPKSSRRFVASLIINAIMLVVVAKLFFL